MNVMNENKKKSNFLTKIDKAGLTKNTLISLAVTLIFCVITPIDVILINQNNFSVSYSEMISCIVLPAILVLFVCFMLMNVLYTINRKIYEIFKMLILCVTVSFYCQELFMNGKMVRSDLGTTIGNITYVEESLNVLIHFIMIFFPTVLLSYYLFAQSSKNETDVFAHIDHKFIKNKLPVIIMGCILIMKSVGLVSDFVNFNPEKYDSKGNSNGRFFSYEPTVSFSKENNIYVFIMDRFDSFWCDEFLETYPEVKDELEGFTFYQNNISAYTNTFPSITNMFTHIDYDGSEWYEYFDKAWSGENVFSVLNNNEYKVNLILDESATYGSSSRLSPFCDNTMVPEDLEREIDEKKLREIIFKLSFLRMVPYTFKYRLDNALSDIMNQTYIVYRSEDLDKIHMGKVGLKSDEKIYDYTEKASFNAYSENKVVTAIHLNGAHDTNKALNQKIVFSNNGDNIYKTIRANFETVLRYIRASKDLGVYDNTTFIILGDHARAPESYYDNNNQNKLKKPLVTALLVKPPHTSQFEFKTDDKSQLSNTMLFASILEYAGIDHSKYGDSFNDIIKSKKDVPRKFHTYLWHGVGKVDSLHEYVVNGDARDFSNWELADTN
ncbi:sulfatase-like hydrolase/transferase [Ruminococcus sp. HUN007]|uniref:sulfatase-like hydrolase/transferase n=1 Tax=Ruminococcus sp. HUN007 TaxID=1514668 RepID=UPI0005D280F0|nr:sulfatase-like hydrolase/transferase [Ruminococcus sp. HUN007]